MNAIILAAGLGSRFNDLTKHNHKALLPIGRKPNIERTIEFLHEFGIREIVIVVGHMHELFDYLITKHQVKLIYNPHYADYNSLYSFQLALDYFKDTLVIDADVVQFENVFKKLDHSAYYVVQREKSEDKEWCPIVENKKVVGMEITNEYKLSMLGISYWDKQDCILLNEKIKECMKDSQNYLNPKFYWDNVPLTCFQDLHVGIHEVEASLVGEMDTVENYQEILFKLEKHNHLG